MNTPKKTDPSDPRKSAAVDGLYHAALAHAAAELALNASRLERDDAILEAYRAGWKDADVARVANMTVPGVRKAHARALARIDEQDASGGDDWREPVTGDDYHVGEH